LTTHPASFPREGRPASPFVTNEALCERRNEMSKVPVLLAPVGFTNRPLGLPADLAHSGHRIHALRAQRHAVADAFVVRPSLVLGVLVLAGRPCALRTDQRLVVHAERPLWRVERRLGVAQPDVYRGDRACVHPLIDTGV
jgi:hypothetical protein